MPRILDVLFFFFFLSHIPISILIDFQAIIPNEYYPKQLVEIKEMYCKTFRDNQLLQPSVWYKSFVFCELFIQFPFFFVAAYGYFKGANKCKWLRIPAIIYGTHVATSLIPLLANIMLYDFSKDKLPGPRDFKERLHLMAFYLPYFIFPVVMVLDAVFSSAFTQTAKVNRGGGGGGGGGPKSKNKKVKAN